MKLAAVTNEIERINSCIRVFDISSPWTIQYLELKREFVAAVRKCISPGEDLFTLAVILDQPDLLSDEAFEKMRALEQFLNDCRRSALAKRKKAAI